MILFHIKKSKINKNSHKIVMEFCDAGSVASILNRTADGLSEKQIAIIMKDMLTGLEYLHDKRMLHRDIKADNVLLNSSGYSKLGKVLSNKT